MDGLVAKFLPRFVGLTHDRLRRALEVASNGWRERADGVAHDLHALAGEAGLLGLEGVMEQARTAEQLARRFGASGAKEDAASLIDSLRRLEDAVTRTKQPEMDP
jgi:HPt (histidine-containing phosphotransfer) domain-containing protein